MSWLPVVLTIGVYASSVAMVATSVVLAASYALLGPVMYLSVPANRLKSALLAPA